VSLLHVPKIPESWNLEYEVEVEVDLDDREMDVFRVDRDEVVYYRNQKNPT
jgi:hypothetical protein